MNHEILIIGGGASGITAAICSRSYGKDTAIVEGTDRIAKKILMTGNGRCNISNKKVDNSRYHSHNSLFFENIIKNFTVNDTINFFNSLGLPVISLEEGRLYPMSLQSSSVVDILRLALSEQNIPVYLSSKVKEIKKENGIFSIKTENGEIFKCKKIILACGGCSAPKTGSDGSGFMLAKSLGHHIIKPVPALVQIKLDYKKLKAISGVRFDGEAKIYVNDVLKRKENGELLFTDYGISGIPILQLSRIVSENISSKNNIKIEIDMMNNFSEKDLKYFIENHFALLGERSISEAMIGIINKKMIPIFLKEAGISNLHKPCSMLESSEISDIEKLLKCWEFKVSGTNSFKDSQVTDGGIDTKEINPITLESKIVPGLYFAGEILDVDGDCGGFNLQWAWSSGYIAGKNAGNSL